VAKAYSEDLRVRAIEAVKNGSKQKDVCKNFLISRSALYSWLVRYKKTGSVKAASGYQKGCGHKVADLKKFKKFVDENSGLDGVELAEKWGNITSKTMRKWLHRIGYSCKKKAIFTKKEVKKSVKSIWKKSKQ